MEERAACHSFHEEMQKGHGRSIKRTFAARTRVAVCKLLLDVILVVLSLTLNADGSGGLSFLCAGFNNEVTSSDRSLRIESVGLSCWFSPAVRLGPVVGPRLTSRRVDCYCVSVSAGEKAPAGVQTNEKTVTWQEIIQYQSALIIDRLMEPTSN
jgi:hypothetical protein